MTWHYAAGYVVDANGDRFYGVYEVYEGTRDDDEEDERTMHSEGRVPAGGDNRDELIDDLFRMAKDVMYFDEFEVKP